MISTYCIFIRDAKRYLRGRRGGGGGVISDLMRDPERTQSIRLFMVSLSLVTGKGGAGSNFRGFNKVFQVNLLKHS